MARLISWPLGLHANGREPLSGPRTVGASRTESISGFVQTTSRAFGLWRWRFVFPPLRGIAFRRYRGWVTALHGGANATRVPFCDWDGLAFAELGITGITKEQWLAGQPWDDDGAPWEDGQNWAPSRPPELVAAASLGDTTITLDSLYWGGSLGVGDQIGFYPNHFGLYMITEVIEEAQYRIWPPLRKAVTSEDYATLTPTLAMRLESEEGATAPRGASFAEGLAVTMVEVLDYDLNTYFAD